MILEQWRLFGLTDIQALINFIIGGVLEAADVEALVIKHRAEIRRQSNQRSANAGGISNGLHSRLSSSGVQIRTIYVENIYETSGQGDK